MTNALFICGKARMRSPTAADLAARLDGIDADFAGLSADADERVSSEHIDWADVIFVMERRQKTRLNQLFADRIGSRRVICLNIPDRFGHMEDALVALLQPALERALRR